jgi:hypothetical protein
VSPLSRERKRDYQREYMRSRRGSNKSPSKPRPIGPGATKTKRVAPDSGSNSKPAIWANNKTLWVHPDGRVRNFQPSAALRKDWSA